MLQGLGLNVEIDFTLNWVTWANAYNKHKPIINMIFNTLYTSSNIAAIPLIIFIIK